MIKYREEIDGLRGLAVLPVIFFHAGFEIFQGGYVGVDIFFVISGYLITNLIINELNDKSFSLKKFYERRARRILPTLIFVILITSLLSFIFLSKYDVYYFFRSINPSLLFYSNFYFWKHTPYVKELYENEPLVHTWSLSIEEQFYIIFPLVLILLNKYLKKYIVIFFIFLFTTSLLFCHITELKTSGILNFYFTFSRAWELLLGSICAYLILYNKISIKKFWKNFFSTLGFLSILFSIFLFEYETLHPSFYTLFPTLGTALIILFTDNDCYLKKFLSIKLLAGIGLISFSLYLWHQPVIVFARSFFENFSNEKKILCILLSTILSLISY
uniref:acyltransferase family protein n=1 Tax=Candidatus Pelagibacter sp. HIMB1715 TaxID=3413369 RepID=UPI003F834827